MQRLAASYLTSVGDAEASLGLEEVGPTNEASGLRDGQRETVSITLQQPGSAFARLLHGTAQAVFATRRVMPAEAEPLSSLAEMTSSANEAAIGVQGVAVIVNPASSMSSLTVAQLRGILDGRVMDWSQVEGPPGTINLYVVDDRDGTREVPQDVILASDLVAATVIRVPDEHGLVEAVAADSAGIGLATFGNTGVAKVLAIAVDGADAVAPSKSSISTETYPLSRRIYLYANPRLPTPPARRFASYVASADGQSVVDGAGLVPFAISAEPAAVPGAAPAAFKQFVAGAARLSVTFRFQPGSVALDGRAMRDVELLGAYLRAQRIDPGRVLVAGFADDAGDATVSRLVSQWGVEAVVVALAKAGAMPGQNAAFGGDLPVADNATAESRERNRRVEVYLAPPSDKPPAIGIGAAP